MKRDRQIKCKVSEEEKKRIEANAEKAGFANVASYIRSRCLNENQSGLYLYQKCEIRDSLQKINDLAGNDSRVLCHTGRIHNILDKAGDN